MRAFKNFSFSAVVDDLTKLLFEAPDVHVGEWQAIQGEIPQADTIEVEDISFQVAIPPTLEEWQKDIKPNLPWAEDHFQERVSGVPYNPPPSAAWWPFAQNSHKEHTDSGLFSHTYPERFWPNSGAGIHQSRQRGIRYTWGDLQDVVILLKNRPGTRQGYLPVWYPEDTGAKENQRVPCTLGYHFLLRNGRLKIVYYIRSCDFYRHFRDDVYLAGRLCQWVSAQLGVQPGNLVMHMSSLHVFSAERGRLEVETERLRSWATY